MKHRSTAAIIITLLCAALPSAAHAQLATSAWLEELQVLKAQLYSTLGGNHAQEVAAGTAQPAVYVEVGGGDAPVSWIHFDVPAGQVAALAAAIPLPAGFTLAPVSVLADETPAHTVTLSIYEVAGERGGKRAEWTTYVNAPGETAPRVMMLETATSESSLDPVDLASPAAATFDYALTSGVVDVEIASGASTFTALVQVPDPPMPGLLLDPSWGATADTIYWSNGVADLQSVNGLVANREVIPVPTSHVTITDGTPWAAFVDPAPRAVLLFEERIDAVIQPWVNADDPSVPLDPSFRDQLLATKASAFSAIETQRADAIALRAAEPLADFFVEPSPPSIYMNFEIITEQRDALAAAIPLPWGFELAPVQPIDGTPPRYLLSLNIYETVGIASGLRAEWSVYVTHVSDPVPRYMIVEARSDALSLDPVDKFTSPADVFVYTEAAGIIDIDVQAPGTSFQATFPLPASPTLLDTTLSWAEANNVIYWRNGVADKIYYNGLVYDSPVIDVPTATVSFTDATAWAPYLQLHQVLVYPNQLEFLASPWNNLNAAQAPEPGPLGSFVALLGTLSVLARARSRRTARKAAIDEDA